jgi:dTDP-glucose 4,6-dehydratase
MRVVVTGGAGFIGSAFINRLMDKFPDIDVLCVDKLTYAGKRKNIKHDVSFLQKDICDVTPEDLGSYDYLVHFAAESHVDNSIENGRPFVRTNVEGTFNMIECARQNPKLDKFIHISTDEVYGDMADHYSLNHSATELEQIKPSSYYSATKAASDMLVQGAHRTFGLPYLITRTCNNFGEHQDPEKFLPKIYQCVKNGGEVPVYGDGGQVREWIYVYDNVEVILDLMFDEEAVNTVYNIGSGVHYRNIDLVNMISEILGKDVNFKFVADRLGHDRAYRLNCTKLKKYYKDNNFDMKYYNIKDYLLKLYGNDSGK